MFGRKVRLTLNNGVEHVYTDLDIRFTIRNNCNFINDAKIDLLNPKREIIEAFSAIDIMYKESFDARKVKLEVGWADGEGGLSCIFDGVVISAMPSSYPPDIWLSMTCIGYAYANRRIPVGADGKRLCICSGDVNEDVSFSTVIDKLGTDYLGKIGMSISTDVGTGISTKTMREFCCGDTVRDMMQNIRKIHPNLEVYTEGMTIFVKDKTISASGASVQEITMDNGMIGIPRCNWPFYYVETLLRTDVKLWSDVRVKSNFNVFYNKDVGGGSPGGLSKNGDFRVMGITYTGQLRSGKWAMTLDLLQKKYAEIDRVAEIGEHASGVNVK